MFDTQNEKTLHSTPTPRWGKGRVLAALGRNIRAGQRRWRREKVIAELGQMDDRMLSDIGISRSDIPRIVDSLVSLSNDRVSSAAPMRAGSQGDVSQLEKAA